MDINLHRIRFESIIIIIIRIETNPLKIFPHTYLSVFIGMAVQKLNIKTLIPIDYSIYISKIYIFI